MRRRSLFLVFATLGMPFSAGPTPVEASPVFLAGAGTAQVTVHVGDETTTCLIPLVLTLALDNPGFVLTQAYATGFASGGVCGSNEVVQATHVASDLSPPLHRCWVSTSAGGVGIASSPYTLKMESGTYTISRTDRVACSYDLIKDTMTLVPGAVITFTRDMSLGTDFFLTVRASVPRVLP